MARGICLCLTLCICLLVVLPVAKCTDLVIDCTSSEQDSTFACLNIFFIAHVDVITQLVASNDCDLTNIDCAVFNTTVACVNGLTLTEECRSTIRDYVDSVIADQSILCTVNNMEEVCPASPHILTIQAGGSPTSSSGILLLIAFIGSLFVANT